MHQRWLIHIQDNPNTRAVCRWHAPGEPHTQASKILTCQPAALGPIYKRADLPSQHQSPSCPCQRNIYNTELHNLLTTEEVEAMVILTQFQTVITILIINYLKLMHLHRCRLDLGTSNSYHSSTWLAWPSTSWPCVICILYIFYQPRTHKHAERKK